MSKVYFTKDPMALTSAVNYQSGYLLMPINFMTNNHQNEGQAT